MAIIEQATGAALGGGLASTRGPLQRAHHVPGYIYSSAEVLRMEKEKIFMKDWLCVGRVEELANPGDYLTLTVVDEPVLVTRGADGALNAVANQCRHRGVEVAYGRGNARQFSCPYHGWTYDLEGRLIGAAYMDQAETFDASRCRLHPLRIDAWAGWIFISFDPEAEPLADFVADFERDFAIYRQDKLRLADTFVLDMDCNWKMFVENAMDNYHVNTLHDTTLGKDGWEAAAVEFELRRRGGHTFSYQMPPRGPAGTLWFDRKMPWLEDKPDDFAHAGFLAPNMQTFTYVDNVSVLVCWPTSVSSLRLMFYVLFPEDFFTLPNFKDVVKTYCQTSIDTIAEDTEMVQSLQRATGSRWFEPGPMSHVEKPIHHALNYYLDRMFGEAA